MDKYIVCVVFLMAIMVSWRIPIYALRILRDRKEPVYPAFLCVPCRCTADFCSGCVRYVHRMKWKVAILFVITSTIGIVNVDGWERLIFLLFLLFIIQISLIDSWSQLIPNRCTVPAMVLFFFFRMMYHTEPVMNYTMTSILVLAGLFLLGWATRGLGGGDAKFLAVCALVLGWPSILLALWFATMSALFFIGYRSFSCPVQRRKPFPFGPHLAVGCYVAYIWGESILGWYLQFVVFSS